MYTDKKKSVDEAKGLTINKSEDVQRKSSSSSEDLNAGSDKNFIIQENITHDYRIKVGSQSIQDEKETHESSLNVINHKMNDESTNIDVTCVDEMKGEEKNNINFESGENLVDSDSSQEVENKNQFENFECNEIKSNEVKNETGLENDEKIVQMTSAVMQSCFHRNADDSHDTLAFCALWDFAGQKDFYATHQVFLSKCAVFLLVTDSLESSNAEKLWIDFKETARKFLIFFYFSSTCFYFKI